MMEAINLFTLFCLTNAILWVFLIIVTAIMGNPYILKRKGYPENYISFLKRDYTVRSIILAIVLPAIQVAAYFISKLIVEDPSSRIDVIGLIFILMIIPFPVIDSKVTSRKLKKIRDTTDEAMVIDLKYKTLHLIYNPVLESILTILTVVCAVIIIKPFALFYLHICLPWILYLVARNSSRTIRPHLKDGYLWAFVFIILNFTIIIYYLTRDLISAHDFHTSPENSMVIFLLIALGGRIFYYLFNYREFLVRLSKG